MIRMSALWSVFSLYRVLHVAEELLYSFPCGCGANIERHLGLLVSIWRSCSFLSPMLLRSGYWKKYLGLFNLPKGNRQCVWVMVAVSLQVDFQDVMLLLWTFKWSWCIIYSIHWKLMLDYHTVPISLTPFFYRDRERFGLKEEESYWRFFWSLVLIFLFLILATLKQCRDKVIRCPGRRWKTAPPPTVKATMPTNYGNTGKNVLYWYWWWSATYAWFTLGQLSRLTSQAPESKTSVNEP